jgi:hypothetical protein
VAGETPEGVKMGTGEELGILVLIIAVVVVGGIALVTWSTPKGTGLKEWGGLPEKPAGPIPPYIPRESSLFFVIAVLILVIGYTGLRLYFGGD